MQRTKPIVEEVEPDKAQSILPGANFADAWAVSGLQEGADAQTVTAQVFDRAPNWIKSLLNLRNLIVAPLGLKTQVADGHYRLGSFAFPVISSAYDRVVLGFDDRHLDFRIVIQSEPENKNGKVTTATYVRTHNLAGRLYLGVVKPFHRRIVPAMMKRAVTTL